MAARPATRYTRASGVVGGPAAVTALCDAYRQHWLRTISGCPLKFSVVTALVFPAAVGRGNRVGHRDSARSACRSSAATATL